MNREIVPASELKLPLCPIPRPGDRVLWYQDALVEFVAQTMETDKGEWLLLSINPESPEIRVD